MENRILINYGCNLRQMAMELMETAQIADQIGPDTPVVLKPNLVVARPADGGATTHPEIAEGVIAYLQAHNIRDITIAEGSWVGDSTKRAWQACGYSRLAQTYNVKLLDTKGDKVVSATAQGIKLTLCQSIARAGYLINLPVLKGHCQTDMTCCLKNLKGCIPDSEKRRFHTMGLHKPIAALAQALRPQLHIVDSVCGDLSFEEGGNPIESNRILLGTDPVLLDSYGAQLMGYEPDDIEYLRLAREYGVGRYVDDTTEIVELNADNRPTVQPLHSSAAKRLAPYIDEDSACSACYASLIFALDKAGKAPGHKLHIGQGYKGKSLPGMGIGNCCSGCATYVKGCPPKAVDILRFLQHT
ncbi:DUF362 domain-containing protein [Ruminococcaceae bacterium OttesenSCG-928-L11]|nr:DUF362 domain-containing protein [Ruminococcaceae bacterium OttesenSCG-928-L11]